MSSAGTPSHPVPGWLIGAGVGTALIFGRSRTASVGAEPPYPELIELMLGALVAIDRDRRIVYAGGATRRLFGRDGAELVGRPVEALVAPESRPALTEILQAAPEAGTGPSTELRGPAAPPNPGTPLRALARRLPDRVGGGHALFFQDLTEREELVRAITHRAAELSRSNRDLEQFAYVASHDLQEPLRMIGSYTQLIEERYGDRLDPEGREFLRFAHDGVARMRELIEDLLAFARVGSRGQPFTHVRLDEVAERVLSNLREAIRTQQADVQFGPLPEVSGDRTQLVQLFQNLVGNALKFTRGTTPKVRVSAERTGTEWTFRVSDNGIGIPPESQEKVFLIFQRLHTREEYPGSGIGLSICRRVVERHGGRIWVQSTGVVGAGTTFWFTLPSLEAPPVAITRPAAPPPESAVAARAERLIEERLRELI